MKKLIAFILCVVTVGFSAGCKKNESEEKEPEEKTEIG